VAAVRGHAIGAGFQLALGCDLRVLADDAKLCMKEPSLGLVPDLLGTKPLVDIVGLPRALELCLTGRSVPAAEARDLRLAELVVPAADLDGAVADLAAALLAVDPGTAGRGRTAGAGRAAAIPAYQRVAACPAVTARISGPRAAPGFRSTRRRPG